MKQLDVFVDCQKDFMYEDGALPVPDAEELLSDESPLAEMYSAAVSHMRPRLFTGDFHVESDEEIDTEDPDFVDTFPMHCPRYEEGSEIVNIIQPKSAFYVDHEDHSGKHWPWIFRNNHDIVLWKNKFNLCEGSPYGNSLMGYIDQEFDIIQVAGVSGNVCVKHFVEEAIEKTSVQVLVNPLAIRSLPPEGPLEEESELFNRWSDKGVIIDG